MLDSKLNFVMTDCMAEDSVGREEREKEREREIDTTTDRQRQRDMVEGGGEGGASERKK